jgi:hypothetical protein
MSTFEKYITNQSPGNFNYEKLVIAPDSKYSCLMPWHIEQISKIILNETKDLNIQTIIDCTANIGCDSILFRLLYPYSDITSIELNKNTFNLLTQNMDNICPIVGKYVKSINTLNKNCLDIVFQQYADIFYFDPPWEGVDYKNQKLYNLTLSGYDMGVIINNLLNVYNSLFIVKLPYNLDFAKYESQITNNLKARVVINYHNVYTSSGKISYILSFIKFF